MQQLAAQANNMAVTSNFPTFSDKIPSNLKENFMTVFRNVDPMSTNSIDTNTFLSLITNSAGYQFSQTTLHYIHLLYFDQSSNRISAYNWLEFCGFAVCMEVSAF